jgi:hypothetical protein
MNGSVSARLLQASYRQRTLIHPGTNRRPQPMKRLLIASIAIACGASLALSASPEVDKAIKTIQGVTADPAKMQLFCALDQASDTEGQANPEQEKQAEEILGKLGADFEAAWDVGDNLDDKSADGVEFAAAVEAVAAKCP